MRDLWLIVDTGGNNAHTGKFWSYKVAISLLYGDHPGIRRVGGGEVVVHHSDLAAYFGIKNDKLLLYIDRLVAMGIIVTRTKAYGTSVLLLKPPLGWK